MVQVTSLGALPCSRPGTLHPSLYSPADSFTLWDATIEPCSPLEALATLVPIVVPPHTPPGPPWRCHRTPKEASPPACVSQSAVSTHPRTAPTVPHGARLRPVPACTGTGTLHAGYSKSGTFPHIGGVATERTLPKVDVQLASLVASPLVHGLAVFRPRRLVIHVPRWHPRLLPQARASPCRRCAGQHLSTGDRGLVEGLRQ